VRDAVIEATPPRVDGDTTTWTGILHPGDDEPAEVTFAWSDGPEASIAPDRSIRPFLLAFLPAAMRLGLPVRVAGPLDQTTIDGALEWQEAMAAWHPDVLRPVPIVAEGEPATPSETVDGALCAFSGGVDSCFSVVRHRPTEPGAPPAVHRRTTVVAGAMVHGFDISLDDDATFASAYARSRRILEGLGVRAHRVRTDVRRLEHRFPVDWETTSHGIWLTAALACLEDGYRKLVIPSTYPYRSLRLPWASTPVTDPLLGSARAPVWHDGSGADKLDKVRSLAPWYAVTNDVRVCWEGDRLDRNCGRCFKCVSTQVCFWVSGVDRPGAFDVPASLDDVRAVDFSKDPYKVSLHARLVAEARSVGRADLVDALGAAVPT
jgi:hypothetical protein